MRRRLQHPWTGRRQRNLIGAIPGHKPNALLAGRLSLHLYRRTAGLRAERPRFSRPAGDCSDIGLCFLRQRSLLGEPLLDPPRAGIVGGGGKAEVPEFLRHVTQQTRGRRYRLQWIEWIVEAPVAGSLRHELRDAERARRTDGMRPETAFLVQEANKEMRRQIIVACRLDQRVADFLARAVDNRLEKRTQGRQRQHDPFKGWRNGDIDVLRRFSRRKIDCHLNRVAQRECQSATDNGADDDHRNDAIKAEARSLHDHVAQPANDKTSEQNDENNEKTLTWKKHGARAE